jgi:hypothetical protein
MTPSIAQMRNPMSPFDLYADSSSEGRGSGLWDRLVGLLAYLPAQADDMRTFHVLQRGAQAHEYDQRDMATQMHTMALALFLPR